MRNRTLTLILCKKTNIVVKLLHNSIKNAGMESIIISDQDKKNTEDVKIFNNQELKDANFMDIPRLIHSPTAWDKAFYYLYKSNLEYDYYYLIEDDVYCKDFNNLIDFMKNPTLNGIDLVTARLYHKKDCLDWWHWEHTKLSRKINKFFPEKYCSFNPLCRLSKELVKHIFDMYESLGLFFFQEIMIPTVCKHHDLSHISFTQHPNLEPYFGHFDSNVKAVTRNSKVGKELRNGKIIHPVKF